MLLLLTLMTSTKLRGTLDQLVPSLLFSGFWVISHKNAGTINPIINNFHKNNYCLLLPEHVKFDISLVKNDSAIKFNIQSFNFSTKGIWWFYEFRLTVRLSNFHFRYITSGKFIYSSNDSLILSKSSS